MTLVFPDHKLAYIAVPKTATVSIEKAFGTYAHGYSPDAPLAVLHMNLQQVTERYGEMTTVAVVREPFEWLSSFHRYMGGPHYRGTPWDMSHMTFERFAQKYMNGQILWPEPFRRQCDYVTNEKTGAVVDRLFAYESIVNLVLYLSAKISRRVQLGVHNKSPDGPNLLSDETAASLRDYMADDFKLKSLLI
jgi:hypothetical protein